MSDSKERHFLLSVMIPVSGENYIKNLHYTIPKGATLPRMGDIRHNLKNFYQPSPKTVEVLAISEISEEDARTLFAGVDHKFAF